MKFYAALIFSVLIPAIMAAAGDLKSVIISYPSETPDSVVEDAKKEIKDAGGSITHEYTLIKGFSAQAPKDFLTQFSTKDAEHKPTVEDDQVVSING